MATPNNYNSQTGIYRFAVPNTTRLMPVGVSIYGAKYDDKQISMSGSRQYAQLDKIAQ
jgi:Asp-tRNA(Asn)/Glu-tRNA(Gln) amidotransferase A subunit family amidase